jgi:hypothetical protein
VRPKLCNVAVLATTATVFMLLAAMTVVSSERVAGKISEDRIRMIGGFVAADDDFSVTVAGVTHSWQVAEPGRMYHVLAWDLFLAPRPALNIDLSRRSLTIADCKVISAVCNAAVLQLKDGCVSSEGLAYLLAMPSLQIVDLRGVWISRQDVKALIRNKSVRVVIVTAGLADADGLRTLAFDKLNCEVISE